MKNPIYFFFAACLLSFALTSCESAPKEETTTNVETPDASIPPLINGVVKSIKSKQTLSGVSVTVGGKTQTTGSNGTFGFSYQSGSSVIASYSKSGFEGLQHSYVDFDQVDQITVYLEEAATTNKTNKSIRGLTLKSNPTPNNPIAVKNIKVSAMVSGRPVSNTSTNNNGFYSLSFTNATPTFEYKYKINSGSTLTTKVEQRSNIKDSTDIDIIFDEAVGGVHVDTLNTN